MVEAEAKPMLVAMVAMASTMVPASAEQKRLYVTLTEEDCGMAGHHNLIRPETVLCQHLLLCCCAALL